MSGGIGAAEVIFEQSLFDHFLFGDFHAVFEGFAASNGEETGDGGVIGGTGISGDDMSWEAV
ncbi:MAG: hypothetical protein RLZZ458_1904 [Planctomycetota bacterium]